MSKYKIHRWDIIMTGNSTFKSPIIYIKPDLDFLEFARSNNFALMAVIEGTGLQYDGNQIPAVVNKGFTFPNYLPNLSDATGYYVIVLDSNSYGYPKDGNLGTVSFLGLVKTPTTVVKNKDEDIVSNSFRPTISGNRALDKNKSDTAGSGMKNRKRNLLVVGAIIVLLVLFYHLAKTLCK